MHIYPQHSFNKAFAYIVVMLLCHPKEKQKEGLGKEENKKGRVSNLRSHGSN